MEICPADIVSLLDEVLLAERPPCRQHGQAAMSTNESLRRETKKAPTTFAVGAFFILN
jgi:hypothetical protein